MPAPCTALTRRFVATLLAALAALGGCQMAPSGSAAVAAANAASNPPYRAPTPQERASEVAAERKARAKNKMEIPPGLPDECVCTDTDRQNLAARPGWAESSALAAGTGAVHLLARVTGETVYRPLGALGGAPELVCSGATCNVPVRMSVEKRKNEKGEEEDRCVANLDYCKLCIRRRAEERVGFNPEVQFKLDTKDYTFDATDGIRLQVVDQGKLKPVPPGRDHFRDRKREDDQTFTLRPGANSTTTDVFHDAKVRDKDGNPCDFKDPLFVNTSN